MTTKTTIAITGDTYPVKSQLRALGGTWNHAKQAWMVPAERAEEARRIVREQPVRINEFSAFLLGKLPIVTPAGVVKMPRVAGAAPSNDGQGDGVESRP